MTEPKRQPRLLRVALVAAVCLAVGGAVAAWAVDKMKGEPEVVADIDRHFDQLAEQPNTAPKRPSPELDTAPESKPPETAVKQEKRNRGKRKSRRQRKAPQAETTPRGPALPRFPGIERIAPGTFTLSQDLAEKVRANPKPFIQGVRALLTEYNGAPIGFKVVGIRPGSPIAATGVRNGDVLTAVNGHKLTSIDEALLAAGAMKVADRFRIDLLRFGRNISLYYQVR